MVVSLLHVPIMLSMHVLFVLGRRPRTREPVNPHHLSSKGGRERESEKERTFLYVCVYIYMVLRNEYIILCRYYDECQNEVSSCETSRKRLRAIRGESQNAPCN